MPLFFNALHASPFLIFSPVFPCPPPPLFAQFHSVAAYYPESPSSEAKAAALGFVEGIRLLDPCIHCREAFAVAVEEDPPDVSSRESFSLWTCRQHNRVNETLGKPEFPCTPQALSERWRTGCKTPATLSRVCVCVCFFHHTTPKPCLSAKSAPPTVIAPLANEETTRRCKGGARLP